MNVLHFLLRIRVQTPQIQLELLIKTRNKLWCYNELFPDFNTLFIDLAT